MGSPALGSYQQNVLDPVGDLKVQDRSRKAGRRRDPSLTFDAHEDREAKADEEDHKHQHKVALGE